VDNFSSATEFNRVVKPGKLIDPKANSAEFAVKRANCKPVINLVVVGHVDAGKSTLMGHLLFQLGSVSKKKMHSYESNAKKMGKASFAFAWVLDETDEERSRGITMDVAQNAFETDHKQVVLLDAPGHKDFIPNMITGAAQADAAVLVVDATRGEFETGFEMGGQTREHALLLKSLGVNQLLVAVNKLDNEQWSKDRFNDVQTKLKLFLKQAGYKTSEVPFVPCSGLAGENLCKRSTLTDLTDWYKGPSLLELIDSLKPPERPLDKALRMCVNDVFKGAASSLFSVSGRVEAGAVKVGQKIVVMPANEACSVKGKFTLFLIQLICFD
jgi:elongation factor 1 alpha-like protein